MSCGISSPIRQRQHALHPRTVETDLHHLPRELTRREQISAARGEVDVVDAGAGHVYRPLQPECDRVPEVEAMQPLGDDDR
jgi:hypothetical protein